MPSAGDGPWFAPGRIGGRGDVHPDDESDSRLPALRGPQGRLRVRATHRHSRFPGPHHGERHQSARLGHQRVRGEFPLRADPGGGGDRDRSPRLLLNFRAGDGSDRLSSRPRTRDQGPGRQRRFWRAKVGISSSGPQSSRPIHEPPLPDTYSPQHQPPWFPGDGWVGPLHRRSGIGKSEIALDLVERGIGWPPTTWCHQAP
jgi:hypothetical protein